MSVNIWVCLPLPSLRVAAIHQAPCLPDTCLRPPAGPPLPAHYHVQQLGAEALARLEHQLYAYGKENILELVQVGAGGR